MIVSLTKVIRHFHWMATHGVDGAFLQRFVGQVDITEEVNVPLRKLRDEIGDVVLDACEVEGRTFAIMLVTNQLVLPPIELTLHDEQVRRGRSGSR
jgi:hypothetical protein